jgi:hypothetical protein
VAGLFYIDISTFRLCPEPKGSALLNEDVRNVPHIRSVLSLLQLNSDSNNKEYCFFPGIIKTAVTETQVHDAMVTRFKSSGYGGKEFAEPVLLVYFNVFVWF